MSHPALDELDVRILAQLQADSSLSNLQLAERVHASAPTCLRRVQRLREQGFIQKEVAILDPQKLGSCLTAIIEVTLERQGAEHLAAFEQHVAQETEITQCYRVSSGPDFVLIASVTDMPAYHALAHRALTAQRNVRNVRSFFTVYRSKFETRLPLPEPERGSR
ncbi:Lrp/AsnC family transcriptional regulator [Pusillimonas sp. CC-YST705]|uniref:Lrp/AsnC family transcriptional regulator n=1 Tax=Mesopusillimonas faecipullorum TaxID=2755040 RepID=A0ABS8C9M0_9BURK|nr:Lrp/AsnC family transcriptional regulator [Mesopusillimonas faecipullorum]MCB5362733.1 Lrp/AsnC family transcriptional regulator [Mesopusillimonas faecipullorum]